MESGSATSEINVVRRFIRKKNNTTMTKTAPSNSEVCRLDIDASMKSLCLNMSVDTWMSAGSVAVISSRADMILFVNSLEP